MFTAISGDLVGSSSLPDRDRISTAISAAIRKTYDRYAREFVGRLTTTKGIDEVSAVLNSPASSYSICRRLNEAIYPHMFRFAIVQGRLDIGIDTRDAGKMDGPAFHIAAALLEKAKKENIYYTFKVGGKQDYIDELLTEIANLSSILRMRRSHSQHRIIEVYNESENQAEVARKLQITQQAVSEAMRKASWRETRRSDDLIDRCLRTISKELSTDV